jgi:hypothetical protein
MLIDDCLAFCIIAAFEILLFRYAYLQRIVPALQAVIGGAILDHGSGGPMRSRAA